MTIREYANADEKGWLACRVVSFLDCSYFNDVKTEKETYLQPSICLVAEENGKIIGPGHLYAPVVMDVPRV